MQREPLARKAAWSALATALNVGGKLVASAISTRILGPADAGRLMLLVWITEVLVITAGLGLPQAVVRFVGAAPGRPAGAFGCWAIRRYACVTGIAALGAGYWFGPALGICVLSQALGTFYISWLTGLQSFRAAAALNAVSGALSGVLVPLLAATGGPDAAVAGYAIASSISALLGVMLLRGTGGGIPASVWPYSLATWSAALVSLVVWSRSELFFIGRYAGQEAVAMFGAGLTLAGLAAQLPVMFCGALIPHFAALSAGAGDDELRRVYRDATRLLALAVIPGTALASALCPILLPLVYGPAFTPAVPAASVLIAGAGVAFANVGSAYVYAAGRSLFIGLSNVIAAPAALLLFAWAIPHWGIWGAAWVRIAVQSGAVVSGCWYIHRRLRTPVPVRDLLLTFACAWSAGLLASVVVLHRPSIFGAVLATSTFAVVFTCTAVRAGLLDCAVLDLVRLRKSIPMRAEAESI